MPTDISSMLPEIIPFIFFFSLLLGSFVYLLLRLRGTHAHVKDESSRKHAAITTAGVVVLISAFGLALACILVFETFNIIWS